MHAYKDMYICMYEPYYKKIRILTSQNLANWLVIFAGINSLWRKVVAAIHIIAMKYIGII